MAGESYRTTVARLIWQAAVGAALASLLLATWALGKLVYFMAQEAIVAMLLIAILVAVIFLFLVAFVLFQEGIRRAILWTTTGIGRLAKLSHRYVR
jgi:hypothetical protein